MDKQTILFNDLYKNNCLGNDSKIIQLNEKTLLIEEGNTIYEIDMYCAMKHGYITKRAR